MTDTPSTSHSALYRRILRRETHSPRSTLSIVLATILIVAFAWVATELVLSMLGQPALLVAPADMFRSALDLPAYPAGLVIAAGIVAAILGIVLIVLAIASGRRARHALDTGRSVTVVDDEVIASALARHASSAGRVDPDNTIVSVGKRSATVRLTPSSGTPVDEAAVAAAVSAELDAYRLTTSVRPRVVVDSTGRVGA